VGLRADLDDVEKILDYTGTPTPTSTPNPQDILQLNGAKKLFKNNVK
jgi:hypothetical protein